MTTSPGVLRYLLVTAMMNPATVGCAKWREVNPTPGPVEMKKRPEALRVTRLDGSRVVLLRPYLTRDSVVGAPEGAQVRLAIPRDSVRAFAVRGTDAALTAVTVVAGLGLAFAALCLGVEGVCFPGD